MSKFKKLSTLALFGAIALSAAACNGGGGGGGGGGSTSNPKLAFWHNFGANYTNHMTDSFLTPLKNNEKLVIEAESKGSYDKLLNELSMTLAQRKFPNIATGYPDHLSTYARSGYPASRTGVLLNLNPYLDDENLNKDHKAKYGRTLREDFYPEYMVENNSIAYDEQDNQLTVGLPFNKSTEVMGYNAIFVAYAKSLHSELKIPETWAEWETYGKTYRAVQMSLNGKYLVYTKVDKDTFNNFSVVTSKPSSGTFLDFSEAEDAKTAVLSWDSLANMFITLVRQYGSEFTSYTTEDRHEEDIVDQHGYMEFYSGDHKAKTVEAMQMVKRLSGDPLKSEERVFAIPEVFGGNYSSDAFSKNKVMFTICSTGGLSYNINEGQRFKVAPIPYKDASHKYVISQGANITIFKRKSFFDENFSVDDISAAAFKTVVKMTTGDYQATWATKTGYYPASKSATESKIYQDFINGSGSDDDAISLAYREGAQLNQNEYMTAAKGWHKFVDPGFDGSATIRLKVNGVIGDIINKQKTMTIDDVLQSYYTDPSLVKYVRG